MSFTAVVLYFYGIDSQNSVEEKKYFFFCDGLAVEVGARAMRIRLHDEKQLLHSGHVFGL